MKKGSTIELITVITLIILLAMISFIGIYTKDKNAYRNIVKDYNYGMDLSDYISIKYEPEGETDYEKCKNIFEERLESYGVPQYYLRQDAESGEIVLDISNDAGVANILEYLAYEGRFEIKDSESDDILMDNSHLDSSRVLYTSDEYGQGTIIYVDITFTKEGKQKLSEISEKYTEESETKVTFYLDDQELMSTAFASKRTDGKMQFSMGSASTNSNTLQGYVIQATNIATLLDNGQMPIKYTMSTSRNVESSINSVTLGYISSACAFMLVLVSIGIMAKYKFKGVISVYIVIGFIAALLLTIRYTNTVVTIEGWYAIAISVILQIICVLSILNNKYNLKTFTIRMTPLIIIYIVFCFMSWTSLSSFGTIMFWSTILMFLTNTLLEREIRA